MKKVVGRDMWKITTVISIEYTKFLIFSKIFRAFTFLAFLFLLHLASRFGAHNLAPDVTEIADLRCRSSFGKYGRFALIILQKSNAQLLRIT